jgi:hypothetical protein
MTNVHEYFLGSFSPKKTTKENELYVYLPKFLRQIPSRPPPRLPLPATSSISASKSRAELLIHHFPFGIVVMEFQIVRYVVDSGRINVNSSN